MKVADNKLSPTIGHEKTKQKEKVTMCEQSSR
jgi:hypothetical protein